VYKPEESCKAAAFNNNQKSFYKSNSNQETNFSLLNSSFERKSDSSGANRFSRTYSASNIDNTQQQRTSYQLSSNPNIIFISDLFSKVHLFGLYDMPLYFHSDFIKYLKLKIPKNIFTLNELKEYLITEIGKEAKSLGNLLYEKKHSEKPIFSSVAAMANQSSQEKLYIYNNRNSSNCNVDSDFLIYNKPNNNSCLLKVDAKENGVYFTEQPKLDSNFESINFNYELEKVLKEEKHIKELLKLNNLNLNNETKYFLYDYIEKSIEDFVSYRDQADMYTKFIKQIDKDNICHIILHLYTFKGFISKSVKIMLKEKFTDKSNLIGFLVILIGVMKCDGINNFFGYFYPRNLVYEEPVNKKRFIRLYKEMECKLPNLVELLGKLDKEKSSLFNRISTFL